MAPYVTRLLVDEAFRIAWVGYRWLPLVVLATLAVAVLVTGVRLLHTLRDRESQAVLPRPAPAIHRL